ncbi:MAG TPA: TraR/DksA C4-type zinc finger protein [Micromonosporaceae bacterium]
MAIKMADVLPDLRTHFDELDASYAMALERHRLLVSSMAGDSSGDDVVDSGLKVAVTGEDEADLRRIGERREQMERALERVAAGTYGICESCGQPIPAERLRLMPGATSCVACKQKGERRARR